MVENINNADEKTICLSILVKLFLFKGLNLYIKNKLIELLKNMSSKFIYLDGTRENIRIPAEIWKKNSNSVKKVFILEKELSNVILDPFIETADTDRNNNYWPTKNEPTRFQLYKQKERNSENPMQRSKKVKERLENDK